MSAWTLEQSAELGAGGYGKVVMARHNATGEKVAAKVISTSRMKLKSIEKEINLSARTASSLNTANDAAAAGGAPSRAFAIFSSACLRAPVRA